MAGGIYLVSDDDELVEMNEAPYDSEAILQQLLAKYPNLLAGDQMDSEKPRRWLLVTREMGLPSDELEGGRWSVDHLFLDQDGIPTLVEAKRGENTQIRREVVGQLLEYAANAVAYWPVERILSEFERRCEKEAIDPELAVAELLDSDADVEDYWELVATNLKAGRVRLVFVADVIPRELRRIVEFLNEQMSPADVFALEVKQFVGKGHRTLVPRVIGNTERKRASRSGGTQWTEERFLEQMLAENSQAEHGVAERIISWIRERDLMISWGRGAKSGSMAPYFNHGGNYHVLFCIYSNSGKIELYFKFLKPRPPFDREEKRHELRERLNQIEGINIPPEAIEKTPTALLGVLADDTALKQFFAVYDWVAEEIRNT
ncbi:hypothetical protein ACFLSZ_06015 [Candidatus Bipolaricaulota bacterium]